VKVRAKCEGRESHFMPPGVWESMREWTPTLPNELPLWEFGVLMDYQIFREWLQRSKPIWLRSSLYYWKTFGMKMSKMGSHDLFEHFKHKLWPKEGPRVKLPIWLPTIKIQESPWFPFVQMACNILLEISHRGLKLCFKPHLNRRFAHKIMGFQSHGSPNFGNFRTPIWEFWDKMTFGCWSRG
jgi:hypothetical protein